MSQLSSPMLQIQDLEARLGTFRLGPVDMSISKGEYRIILGATGSGKTALLETIAGLNKPTCGSITIEGEDITHLLPEKRNLGMVYQDYALFPHMSVEENISFGLRMRGVPSGTIQRRVLETAELVGLNHLLSRTPHNLSGGERQRTAIARALVLEPRLLLLDEPTSALDRHTRSRLREELRQIHVGLGLTVLHITHDLDEAFFLADRISIIQEGKILQEGSPEEITSAPAHRSVAILTGINNFIPAEVDAQGDITLPWKGKIPGSRFSPSPAPGSKIEITVPNWAVEMADREKTGNDTLFHVRARVTEVDTSADLVNVRLELPCNTQLVTCFSRREASLRTDILEPGKILSCRIKASGTHWVEPKHP